ncbi:MAG: PilZ domain-containing protein [Pseudomonadota bacterium]
MSIVKQNSLVTADLADESRSTRRIRIMRGVQITQGATRYGSGSLINVSHDGLALKCFMKLIIGQRYTFAIDGLVIVDGVVVRSFSGNSYGVAFECDARKKKQLADAISQLT